MTRTRLQNAFPILLAAALFGASAPLSKMLLQDIGPVMLAGLLYIGCGFGVAVLRAVRDASSTRRPGTARRGAAEAYLGRSDLPWLVGSLFLAGLWAPMMLMYGLKATPASTAALLLNFETVATTLIAAAAFGEAVGRRVWGAVALVTVAGITLSLQPGGPGLVLSTGAVLVIGAAFLWGTENNLTRAISSKDPMLITSVKGICGGGFAVALSVALGEGAPGPWVMCAALATGFVCYGLSMVLFLSSLRELGAARTSAYFASAPFAGAIAAFVVLMEVPAIQFLVALPLMVVGAVLLATEAHSHAHRHEWMRHEHRHVHDPHHRHRHGPGHDNRAGVKGAHSHMHVHKAMSHSHPHEPDVHHRHGHGHSHRDDRAD